MINFEKHLKEVLYEFDFIVIPNFGAFIANFEVLESNGSSFPSKTFSFNRLLNIDENQKFFNYLVRAENKPISEVQIQWNDFLLNLRSELQKNKRFEIDGLGSVISIDVKDIEFKFIENCNFYERDSFEKIDEFETPSVVNLSSVEEFGTNLTDKSEEAILTKPTSYQEPQSGADNISEINTEANKDLNELENINETSSEDFHEEGKSNQWKFLLWLLPLLIVLFAAFYFWKMRKVEEKSSTISPAIEKVEIDSSVVKIDSTLDSAVVKVDLEPNLEPEKPIDTKPKTPKAKYHVWAGLFKSKSNADKLRRKLRNGGLKAEIQLVKDMRRVYVPVGTESEAKTTVKAIEQLTGDKAVYFEVD